MFYDYIKRNSQTGFMRQVAEPNKRLQDGIKTQLLCGDCEELFSKYECAFSNEIFQIAIANDGECEFDSKNDNLAYFLLSIAWRVIAYTNNIESEDTFTHEEREKIKNIMEEWRGWLYNEDMDKIRNIQQFIIPTKKLPIFENIDFRKKDNVMMDFKTFDQRNEFKHAFTIVQVPFFIFITCVWGKTDTMKGYMLGNRIKPHKSMLPKDITQILCDKHFTNYFAACEKMTDKQKKKIQDTIEKNKH